MEEFVASLLVQFRLGSWPVLCVSGFKTLSTSHGEGLSEVPGPANRTNSPEPLVSRPQRTMPVVGPCGVRAASSPAPTSLWSIITTLTAHGPSWPSWETPSLWSSLTSSWRTVTTFWKSRGPKAPPSGKHHPHPLSRPVQLWLRGLQSPLRLDLQPKASWSLLHPQLEFSSHHNETSLYIFRAGVNVYTDFGI